MSVPRRARSTNRDSTDWARDRFFPHSSGTFSANFSLTLSTSDLGGQIRYTLDGSQPSATSTLYTGPIVVSNTAQVRARTFVPDFLPSPIVSHTFFKLEADVQNFTSNLPIVIIDTFGGAIDAATFRTSYMTIVEPGAGRPRGDHRRTR